MSIIDKVKSIIVEQLGVDEEDIKMESSLYEDDLGADSLDIVELVMALEEESSTWKYRMKMRKNPHRR